MELKKCESLWGDRPKYNYPKKIYVADSERGGHMEEQVEFDFMKKTREQEMKELSRDATASLKEVLDVILKRKFYNDEDIKLIVNRAQWIERI